MIIKVISPSSEEIIETYDKESLLNILGGRGFKIYTPCGGKGRCGKCRVRVRNEGVVLACRYLPVNDIEVILPGDEEASILVHQSEFLEDLPFTGAITNYDTHHPWGVAVDIGTTTVVLYYVDLLSGQIEKISAFLNPQKLYGADVISRITYCQEYPDGLTRLQELITGALNNDFLRFAESRNLSPNDIVKIVVAGNTTMLHLLLGEDPVPIALAPFTPRFTGKQVRNGRSLNLLINPLSTLITLPCISAYVGADILAGLSVLNVSQENYLFLDIGTNGEIALVRGTEIFTCATAAGPAFEGSNITCGMAAVTGAISAFRDPEDIQVIGNSDPAGICGSGIVDIVAYMLRERIIDETGLLKDPFIISEEKMIKVVQQDIREIQLAKSALFSGVKILMNRAGLSFSEIDALFLAGGFGNYINVQSAIEIGLLPAELMGKIFPVGNSAGIGALQYLKNEGFEQKTLRILEHTTYIELSNVEDFPLEFALNMDFSKRNLR